MKKLLTVILFLTLMSGISTTCLASETSEVTLTNASYSLNKNTFNKNNYPEISYTKNGIPILNDFNATYNPLLRAVYATVISPYGYFYSSSSLAESTLLFSIPRGNTVQVIDSNVSSTVAKVRYSDYTGYIRKSNLKF